MPSPRDPECSITHTLPSVSKADLMKWLPVPSVPSCSTVRAARDHRMALGDRGPSGRHVLPLGGHFGRRAAPPTLDPRPALARAADRDGTLDGGAQGAERVGKLRGAQ